MRKITILLAFLLLAGLQSAFAQKAITGKVTNSEDGLVLSGVTVVVKGTTVGTVTDINGAFSLSAPANATTLVVSFIGMKSVEIPIGNQSVFNVVLNPEVQALQDVVVTAFGISRQSKSLTYAAQNVKTEALVEARSLNVVTGLSGRVSGLSVTQTSQGVITVQPIEGVVINVQPRQRVGTDCAILYQHRRLHLRRRQHGPIRKLNLLYLILPAVHCKPVLDRDTVQTIDMR